MTVPRRALIVIDAQQEYFDGPLAIQHPPREESLANILRTVDVAEHERIPAVVVQHEYPEGAPVFAAGSEGWKLHPELERRAGGSWKRMIKSYSSVFAGTGLTEWLRENDIDTVTLVGYMTNNCVLASAAAAEPLGFAVEVLSDAAGAIHLSNEAGTASARQVHETLMALLHSNWAAVTTTEAWASSASTGQAIAKSDLGTSAVQGQAAH